MNNEDAARAIIEQLGEIHQTAKACFWTLIAIAIMVLGLLWRAG